MTSTLVRQADHQEHLLPPRNYDAAYIDRIRERFETSFEPKYGMVWRKMIETGQVNVAENVATPRKPLMNFMDAIQNKQPISMAVPTKQHENGCDCGCLPPILDWEEGGGQEEDDKENDPIQPFPSRTDAVNRATGRETWSGEGSSSCDSDYNTPDEYDTLSVPDFNDDDKQSFTQEANGNEFRQVGDLRNDYSPAVATESNEVKPTYSESPQNSITRQFDRLNFGEDKDDEPSVVEGYDDDEEEESHSSGSAAVNFDISHIVHSSPEKEAASIAPSYSIEEKESLQDPTCADWDVNGDAIEDGDESHSSGSTAVHFDISHIVHSSPERDPLSPIHPVPTPGPSKGENMMSNIPFEEDRIEDEEIREDVDSHSSGSTVVHFDMSHIVHSSPEREFASNLSPIQAHEEEEARDGTRPTHAASRAEAGEDSDDSNSHSSGSTAVRFDISHIVQSSPERDSDPPKEVRFHAAPSETKNHFDSNADDIGEERSNHDHNDDDDDDYDDESQSSGSTVVQFDISHVVSSPHGHGAASPQESSAASQEYFFDAEPNPRLSFAGPEHIEGDMHYEEGTSVDFDAKPYDGSCRAVDTSYSAPSLPQPSNPEFTKEDESNNFSDLAAPVPNRNAKSLQGFSSRMESGRFHSHNAAHNEASEENPGTVTNTSLNATKPRTSEDSALLNGSVLIDLVDSTSEDEVAPPRQVTQTRNMETSTTQPRARRRVNTAAVPDHSDDLDEKSEDSGDNEWAESQSSSECSFQSPEEDSDSSVDNLARRTQGISIRSDDDNDSFDGKKLRGGNRLRQKPTFQNSKPKMTKTTFRRKRGTLTDQYFAEFDEDAFSGQLSAVDVIWSNKLRTTAGQTRLKRSVMNMRPGVPQARSASIELSTKVLDDPERLRSTLLHEMVHAAAWVIDGVSKPPHGKCFKKWANIAMRRIPNSVVTTTHNYEIEFKYAWACTVPNCSFVVRRHSRSVDVTKHCCGKCRGKLVEIDAATGSSKSEKMDRAPKKRAPPSAYNLFVKEKSKVVRERMMQEQQRRGMRDPKVSQSDVMKECARLWRAQNTKT